MKADAPSVSQQQFRQPQGLLGRLAGWYMARENRHLNQMAVEWLDVGTTDDVLEIGFGPGLGIELLVRATSARTILGLDPSAEMVEQARARNHLAVESGRVQLFAGSVDAMPFANAQFARVAAVSNFHVWPSREAGLAEIHRVLRPGGRLVLALRRALESPWPWSAPGVSLSTLRADQKLLESGGFRDVQLATRKFRRRNSCLVATR